MKFKINRKDLAKHIFIVQRAISARTTMQILEGILIKSKDNKISLTATDTEISIVTETSALVEEEGQIVVNGRLFGNIIRKLNNDDIEFLAKVKDVEYTGIFSKITYTINGVKVRNIEKNDGRKLPKVGEEIKLYLNPMKIMQFGDGYGK